MSAYRSSDPALAYGDLPPGPPGPPGPQRWDRERFDRYNRGGHDDRDYYRPPPRRESRFVEADVVERSGPRRFEERERFVEEDRYSGSPRRRPEFLDEPIPADVANRALAPYRRKSIVEREVDIETMRRPRPQLIRRQSSLDTFDRRPLPRYSDEYSIPADVPLRIRRPGPPREPPRDRVREREFEEIRYRDLEPEAFNEYEDIRIRRERSRGPRRVSVSASRTSKSVRSASSSSSSFEEVEAVEEKKVILIGKRGKTRMPKRLAHRQVIIDLGLPFEEEDDFLIIQRALGKEHIDEIIEKSKVYRAEREKTVYKFEEKIEVPMPPPPPIMPFVPVEKEQIIKRTEIFESGSRSRNASPARSVASHHHHHHHGGGDRVVEELEESATVAGPLTVLAHEGRSDREMRRELAALEAERRTLRLEREVDDRRSLALSVRDRDGYEVIDRREVIEERPTREIIRVEKDRKGRMALVRSAR